jgi:hypothetical protein
VLDNEVWNCCSGESAVMLSSLDRAQLDGLWCRGALIGTGFRGRFARETRIIFKSEGVLEMQKRSAGAAYRLSPFRRALLC